MNCDGGRFVFSRQRGKSGLHRAGCPSLLKDGNLKKVVKDSATERNRHI